MIDLTAFIIVFVPLSAYTQYTASDAYPIQLNALIATFEQCSKPKYLRLIVQLNPIEPPMVDKD